MRDLDDKEAMLADTLDGICMQQAEDALKDKAFPELTQVQMSTTDGHASGIELAQPLWNTTAESDEMTAGGDLGVNAEKENALESARLDLDLTAGLDVPDASYDDAFSAPLKNQTDLGFSSKIGTASSFAKDEEEGAQLHEEVIEHNIDGHSLLSSDAELGIITNASDAAPSDAAPSDGVVLSSDSAYLGSSQDDDAVAKPKSSTQDLSSPPMRVSEPGPIFTRSRDKLELGSILDNRYRIKEILGEGGFGVVYDARDLEDSDRRVAIKTLRRTIADYDQAAKRFEREVFLSQSIVSQHAVKIFASGMTEDGIHYFVMEYIEGHALDLYLDRYRKLSLFDTKAILLQVLDALAEAHEKNIVHRDLKPANIIFSKKDNEGGVFVKVLDFGIAKVISDAGLLASEEKLTQTGAWMGSPAYMSPEHLAGRNLSASSDIYAIGLIAIEMLTGRMAIEGETPMEIAVSQMSHEEVEIEDWLLETSLGPIVTKCVMKKSERRYKNAGELREALLSISDDVLKNEYVGVKMRRFTAERKVKSGDTDVGPIDAPAALSPMDSLIISQAADARRRMQILLVIGIVVCLIVIALFIVLKSYIDKSYPPESGSEKVVALKVQEVKILQGAALGAIGAIALPRASVTIVSNPSNAKIIRASDGVVIGKSGDTFEVVRSSATWDLIIRADGFVDFKLPVVPVQRRENFTLTLLPMPKTEAVVGGVPKMPQPNVVENNVENDIKPQVEVIEAPPKRPSTGKKPPKVNAGQWLLE